MLILRLLRKVDDTDEILCNFTSSIILRRPKLHRITYSSATKYTMYCR